MDIWLFVGFFVGCVINMIWYQFRYAFRRVPENIADIVEHYHWSLLLYITGVPFLAGVGSALLIDEALLQDHPFSWGSNHFWISTVIGVFLFIGLLVRGSVYG